MVNDAPSSSCGCEPVSRCRSPDAYSGTGAASSLEGTQFRGLPMLPGPPDLPRDNTGTVIPRAAHHQDVTNQGHRHERLRVASHLDPTLPGDLALPVLEGGYDRLPPEIHGMPPNDDQTRWYRGRLFDMQVRHVLRPQYLTLVTQPCEPSMPVSTVRRFRGCDGG